MQDAADRDRIGQESRGLSHIPIVVDGLEVSRVQERIPVRHVDHGLLQLRPGKVELGKQAARPQVVVVLVDLSQGIADLQVVLVVGHPVLFGAVHRYATVRALEVNVGCWQVARGGCRLARRALGYASRAVVWVRAIGVLAHEGSPAADFGNGRRGEGVEEVIFAEDPRSRCFRVAT